MQTFHWDQRYETGLKEVDDQHRYLVEVINRFGEQLTRAAGAEWDEVQTVFAEVADYARYHFTEEENLAAAAGLDPAYLEEHKEQHRHFMEDVERMHATVTPENLDTAGRLFYFLMHWLVYHILGTDHGMARQVTAVNNGVSPAEARRTQWEKADQETAGPLLESLQGLFQLITLRNRELLNLNATLEAKVAERTEELSVANRLLENLALTDPLTGLPNRRHAISRLNLLWTEAVHDDTPLTAMMIDADGFKPINDTFGHDAGDVVLRELARALREGVRTDDVVCRLGGDEFFILCPRTALADGLNVAEKLRTDIASLHVPAGAGTWQGSISVGVAERGDLDKPEALIKLADDGVYAAKRGGRNRVATAQSVA